MFWSKKDKTQKNKKDKRRASQKSVAGCVGKEKGHGSKREAIHAQAMANFSAAREQIGEDTLDRIAAAMSKKQNSAMERAKRDIQGADVDKVLDELKWMLDNKST